MNWILDKWRKEPAVIVGLIVALLDAAVLFGVPLTADQKAALVTIITASGGLVTRSQVSPVNR